MNKLSIFFVVIAILCRNAMTVMAKEQEPETMDQVYSQTGEFEGAFSSFEAVMEY